jgi:hypothetical protein
LPRPMNVANGLSSSRRFRPGRENTELFRQHRPRDGAIIFRNLVGKLGVLNVECDKCGRRGRYMLARLIARYGLDAKLFDWSDEITADGPRKQAKNLNDQCGARCPDLPKLV